MSRSPRRRKDVEWCRGCDSARADRNGYGRCKECMARLLYISELRKNPPRNESEK